MANPETPEVVVPNPEIEALRAESDVLRAERKKLREQHNFHETRVLALTSELAAANAERAELEALIEAVDDWLIGAKLTAESSAELAALIAGVDNSALVAHDRDVRAAALREAIQVVAHTTNGEALTGEIKSRWYEQALADVADRLQDRIDFELTPESGS